MLGRSRSRWRTPLVGLVGGLLVLTGCSGDPEPTGPAAGASGTSSASATESAKDQPTRGEPDPVDPSQAPMAGSRPNIVLILMDDFSVDLNQTMRTMATMGRRGASYPNSFVVDSLCCVSRAALMTGQYPHQNGVRTNTSQVRDERGPLGGWPAFRDQGNQKRSVNVALQNSGYRTGFVGKYLNEYEYNPGWQVPPLPPGWTEFNTVFGSAYDGWGFDSTSVRADGTLAVEHHPTPDRSAPRKQRDASYAGQVVEDKALAFIRANATGDSPYYLEVAPYATHSRTDAAGAWSGEPYFPPAFRDRPRAGRPGNCGPVACADLSAQELPGFGDDPADNRPLKHNGKPARAWNRNLPQDREEVLTMFRRDRAQMAQSVDRTVARILRQVDDNTVVVLTSDNGLHLGQNGLAQGKGTAYDTDVRVPLYVIGPGIAPGERAEWTSTIDLAATFEDLAGLPVAPFRSGRSLVPSLSDATSRTRNYVHFEHTSEPGTKGDPDRVAGGFEIDRIPSYVAVRGDQGLLIRNDLRVGAGGPQYGYEYYSYAAEPWERRNEFADPAAADRVAVLLKELKRFDGCRTQRRDDPVTPRCRR